MRVRGERSNRRTPNDSALVEVAIAALMDAAPSDSALPRERTGVIVGNTLTGEQTRAQTLRLRWPLFSRILVDTARAQKLAQPAIDRLIEGAERRFKSVFEPVSEDTLAGSLSNTIGGRICNFLDLHGGGYTVDGACSSSLLAIADRGCQGTSGRA